MIVPRGLFAARNYHHLRQVQLMRKHDILSSIFLIGVGVIFAAGAFKYDFFRSGIPGAGLLPLIMGVCLIALSVINLWGVIYSKEEDTKVNDKKFFSQKNGLKKFLLVLSALLGYWFGIKYIGFILITFFFMIYLLRFIEHRKWSMALIFSFITTSFAFFLFKLFLKVQLPKGILGL